MAQETNKQLLEALKHLRNTLKATPANGGICVNVENYIYEHFPQSHHICVDEIIGVLARQWPKYSGCDTYPVPAPKKYQQKPDPHCWAFCYLPNWQGEYGDLRRELLDFLIEELENELR